LIIGPHLTISSGYAHAVKTALSIGATTFQVFSRNPRGGSAARIDPKDVAAARELMAQNSMTPPLIHAAYTMNLAAARSEAYTFARECFADDMQRMEVIPANLYVFHPGSPTTLQYSEGIKRIVAALDDGILEGTKTKILLEGMAGKGSELGRSFEQLAEIISLSKKNEYLGVCLDTCHLFCAGYDIVNSPEDVLNEFDKTVGLSRLHAIHINDSYNSFASHKDHHANIGTGEIGLEALKRFASLKEIKHLPFYLETPQEDIRNYTAEMDLLRK